jgi:hypothetical protein
VVGPGDLVSLVVDVLHCDVGHEAGGVCAVPVVLAGFEVDTVARPDDLDRSPSPLAPADALGDVDGLAIGVSVPCRTGTRREMRAAGRQIRQL